MALEREALSHKIEDDLALRNRNWNKLDSHLAEKVTGENGAHGLKVESGTLELVFDSATRLRGYQSFSTDFSKTPKIVISLTYRTGNVSIGDVGAIYTQSETVNGFHAFLAPARPGLNFSEGDKAHINWIAVEQG